MIALTTTSGGWFAYMPFLSSKLTPAQAHMVAEGLLGVPGLQDLSMQGALALAAYMRLHRLAAGDCIVREGQTTDADRLWLVLQGEVSVQSRALQAGESDLVVRVMGPGSLIGELGLFDGGPRSADCMADSDVLAVSLSRADFMRLLQEQPQAGLVLLLAMAQRMAAHVRDLTRKVQLFAQMNRTLSQSLEQGVEPVPESTGVSSRFMTWPEVGDTG